MAVISTIVAVAGLGLAGYGAYQNYKGQKQAAEAQDRAIAIQEQQEKKRQQQLNLDAQRRQREIVRQAIAARSMSLATVTAQGASGGSALGGAYGQISGRSNVNALGIRQNQEIGNAMFGLNRDLLGAYRDVAAAQSTAAIGQGLTSLGGALMSNSGAFGRVGTQIGGFLGFGGSYSRTGGSAAP